MTDPVALVRSRLLAVSGVTALVGTRVRAGILAQNDLLPAVALQRVFSEEDSHLRGADGLYEARIHVHAVAATRAEAVAIMSAVAGDGAGSGLSHFTGSVGGTHVAAVLPETAEREDARSDGRVEYEVMRAYRVVVQR